MQGLDLGYRLVYQKEGSQLKNHIAGKPKSHGIPHGSSAPVGNLSGGCLPASVQPVCALQRRKVFQAPMHVAHVLTQCRHNRDKYFVTEAERGAAHHLLQETSQTAHPVILIAKCTGLSSCEPQRRVYCCTPAKQHAFPVICPLHFIDVQLECCNHIKQRCSYKSESSTRQKLPSCLPPH